MPGFAALAQARRSVRGFLPDPVPRATVEALLQLARLAPSGANLQPGHFIALTGAPLAALIADLAAARAEARPQVAEYRWFPEPLPDTLKARQRAAGYALYEALGIARRDIAGRRAQFDRNYRFFDAPVGLVITVNRRMGPGGFMDLGMALQTLFLGATDAGLASCGIGALANHADVVMESLGIPPDQMVICGVALGFEDGCAAANRTRTLRADLADYAELHGFQA
ncbi:MAG: nitroreductase [Paracoccaceae bacterium]|nr:nitroreductase [Paracoccaceae bacterium]